MSQDNHRCCQCGSPLIQIFWLMDKDLEKEVPCCQPCFEELKKCKLEKEKPVRCNECGECDAGFF
ncbi:MAG: hypothetical protein Q8O76_10425 [Chloroflexota bacterium]|nr:hypothetical protein [Chloroflexota bacterium]